MSIIDAYGDFEIPDEKSVIEVVEDPVKLVMSYYDLYEREKERILQKQKYIDPFTVWEELHQITLKMFEEKKELKPTPKQIEKILAELTKKNKENSYVGIFLTAVHNQIQLETLVINNLFHIRKEDHIGYCLKSEKKLVLGKDAEAELACHNRKGIIINYGTIKHMYYIRKNKSESKIINLGYIGTVHGGEKTTNINKKDVNVAWVDNELYINEGAVSTKLMDGDPYGVYQEGLILPQTFYYKKQILNFSEKLKEKLKEINFLQKLPELPYEEQYKQVDAFDFNKFEKEVKEIVKEIYEREGKRK